MKYFFSIANNIVEVSFDNDLIKGYLDKDFGLHACPPSAPSISIVIKNEIDMLPPEIRNDNSSEFRTIGGYIYQYFTAFQRHFWARYSFPEKRIEIILFIPYRYTGLSKQFFSPYFEKPLQSCLTDYFHNTFLAVIQYMLMSQDASFFHCSIFQPDSLREAIILAGGAQCGKSSLMTALSNVEPITVYAEDFAVVTSEHKVYGYLHQTRVKFIDMKDAGLKYRPNEDGILTGVLNRCNKRVYSLLTNNNNGRRFSIRDYYKDEARSDMVPLNKRIFLLTREGAVTNIVLVDLKSFCRIQTEILMTEFRNMRGAMGFFRQLSCFAGLEWSEEQLYYKICSIYEKSLRDLQCYNINIPFYTRIEDAAKELERVLIKVHNQ